MGAFPSRVVAALFVQSRGAYAGLLGVDVWGVERDARTYAGPYPVVAHPPCARWGRFAAGAFRNAGRFVVGADGGCFASALASVERFGGVLEHPSHSLAYAAFGLDVPPAEGWARTRAGWVCRVWQGHYGHPAPKETWLYAVGTDTPDLVWGRCAPKPVQRPSPGATARARREGVMTVLSRGQREATPTAFRDVLLAIARTRA